MISVYIDRRKELFMYEPIHYNPDLKEHTIELTIQGEPVGKGRPRVATRGKFAHAYTPLKTKNYETLIKNSYLSNYTYEDMLHGPIEANIKAYFSIPSSTPKKHLFKFTNNYEKHIKKPDIDNVIKSIFDSLNNLAFDDDSNIIKLNATKLYSENPRVELVLKEVKYDILKSNNRN